MIETVLDIKDQLEIANRLKVLELCLKYPEHEDKIKRGYLSIKKQVGDLE